MLGLGGLMHARAYSKAAAAVASSSLPDFYGNSLKALWLIDSATLFLVAAALVVIAARPALASGTIIVLIALIPGATAALLYVFMGSFLPAHLLLVATVLAMAVGLMRREHD